MIVITHNKLNILKLITAHCAVSRALAEFYWPAGSRNLREKDTTNNRTCAKLSWLELKSRQQDAAIGQQPSQ